LRSIRLAGTAVTRRGVRDLLGAVPDMVLPDLGLAPESDNTPAATSPEPASERSRP
jgi:hypothetical protein